ncbi:DUF3299 domain-containing protein [Oceanomicrobium pacificus]|uniref:DUF3299 domain-containing protein n=1 Tax=Oceanomicrobium pacificus TaxID=2692916 RepID=A0A6B0U214_9RHOB|nr:DUF3299 domain-containing protein [Oceanomicrobium pacificus]MXU65081.1 DUF3299 domain-containing protein [Oceanomicrobium pacificus]
MKLVPTLCASALIACLPLGAAAAPATIGWEELMPAEMFEIDNPFEELNADQMNGLRTILGLEAAGDAADAADLERAAEIRAELAADGLDVDWLFEKRLEIMSARRAAETSVNADVVDRQIRMPGYLLPLDVVGRKVHEFLLVPTVGACIHVPPPPANQMVHVTFAEGIEAGGLYEPVWIEGTLRSEQLVEDVTLSDGQLAVEVSYSMEADSVVPYTSPEN